MCSPVTLACRRSWKLRDQWYGDAPGEGKAIGEGEALGAGETLGKGEAIGEGEAPAEPIQEHASQRAAHQVIRPPTDIFRNRTFKVDTPLSQRDTR